MACISETHTRWLTDSEYQKAYKEQEQEFAVARAAIEAQSRASVSQMARRNER